MNERDQLGLRVLELLAEEWMVAVVQELARGAMRPAQLERNLPDVPHSVVNERLRHLVDYELVSYQHQPGTPPHAHSAGIPPQAHYSLTDAGRILLEVIAKADRWGQTWCAQDERPRPAGALAIKLIADYHTRSVMLLLSDGPLPTSELDRRVPDLGRSALRRRLRELVLAGLLEQQEQGRARRYELTSGSRHLALVAMLAGRWEWRCSRPEHPAPGRDLNNLLHLLAPVASVPEPVAGICQLHLDTGGADDPDIYLAARGGHILALAGAPATPPEVVGHATPEAWCDALLLPGAPIMISGNRPLLVAVIGALSTALLA
jgi:DNA-binding HxlR family transcriptional regulator